MKTKDRKRQVKQYQKKLKVVNSYYKGQETAYKDTIARLERNLDMMEQNNNKNIHALYSYNKAVIAFAKYLKRTGNVKAFEKFCETFNVNGKGAK